MRHNLALLLDSMRQWICFPPGRTLALLPQYRLSDGSAESQEAAAKKAEELFEVTKQVTTARFCQYENSLIFDGVFMTSENTVEKRLDDLKNELRFYFDE